METGMAHHCGGKPERGAQPSSQLEPEGEAEPRLTSGG
jgi:hypothetical protein